MTRAAENDEARIGWIEPKEEENLTITFNRIGREKFLEMKDKLREHETDTVMAGRHPSQMQLEGIELGELLGEISEMSLTPRLNEEEEKIEICQPLFNYIRETHEG